MPSCFRLWNGILRALAIAEMLPELCDAIAFCRTVTTPRHEEERFEQGILFCILFNGWALKSIDGGNLQIRRADTLLVT